VDVKQAALHHLISECRADDGKPKPELALEKFLSYVTDLNLSLYPSQEEAILELFAGKHVILGTPTGSGKSMVALALHFLSRVEGKRSCYTAPTKALVNEKFFAWCEAFGAENVGLLTGDATVNREAPVICCTAEILSNMALCGDDLEFGDVVMDEFHYYGDRERGAAWQIPLITLKHARFLLMSATLGDPRDVGLRLEKDTGRKVASIRGGERPVPLSYEYRDTQVYETIPDLFSAGEVPVYLVNFTQNDCAEQAQNLQSLALCSKENRHAIAQELQDEKFDTPYGKEFKNFVLGGIGIHHGGLLPKYRRIIERLSQTGLIKVISGTDTLGVGVNIPIRTVLFRQLYKFDGEKTIILGAREFHQIAGRAGRKGFDDHGLVVVQAPEWVIENQRIDAKLRGNPNLRKKLQKKKPPPKSLPWDKGRFDRLVAAPPEPLVPHFEVTHGMLIHLLQGQKEGCGGYQRLIEVIGRTHTSEAEKKRLRRRAALLFQTLVKAGIVIVKPGEKGATAGVREGFQKDFSLDHTLSLYLVQTLDLLDDQKETHALDILSLVESILENPKVILYRQEDKIKDELIARLKAQGVPYEERMAQLEKAEHPKPNAEFIYETFNAFASLHPWVGGEAIRPKSIAREMVERCMDFNEYVREYGLQRCEGLLLRHLSQAYKVSVQTVPESYWTEEFEDILAFLFEILRRTDASLIEEWELLVAGPSEKSIAEETARPEKPKSIFDHPRALAARVRSELHLLLRALAKRDFEAAEALVYQKPGEEWTAKRFEEAVAPYYEKHAAIDLTPKARQPHNTLLRKESQGYWIAQQRILDPEGPEGEDDWLLDCLIDFREPRDETGPLIEMNRIGN
jgi:hypothetical protein